MDDSSQDGSQNGAKDMKCEPSPPPVLRGVRRRSNVLESVQSIASADREMRLRLAVAKQQAKTERALKKEELKLKAQTELEVARMKHQSEEAERQRRHELEVLDRQLRIEELRAGARLFTPAPHTSTPFPLDPQLQS